MEIHDGNLTNSFYIVNNDSVSNSILQPGSGTTNNFVQATFFQSSTSSWIPFVFGGVFLTPVAILGVLGNILSISVLMQKNLRSSLSVLLIGLSFSDALVCLASIVVIGLPTLFKWFDIGIGFLDLMCFGKKLLFPLALTAQTGSAYFTVAVTFERYIAVCKPLQSRSICTWQRAHYLTIAIVLFSIVINIPRYISFGLREEILHANHTCESNPSKISSKSADALSFIIYTVFMYLIPICVVTVVNCVIIKKIQHQKKIRDELSRHQLKEIKLTNMLIILVASYVFCNIFRLFNAFTKITFGHAYAELVSFTNFLVTLNSAINYLIYCAFGQTFRQSFINLFCKCRRTQGPSTSSRRNQSTIRLRTSTTSDLSQIESSIIKSVRRLSKDIINLVGPTRFQEYIVNEK